MLETFQEIFKAIAPLPYVVTGGLIAFAGTYLQLRTDRIKREDEYVRKIDEMPLDDFSNAISVVENILSRFHEIIGNLLFHETAGTAPGDIDIPSDLAMSIELVDSWTLHRTIAESSLSAMGTYDEIVLSFPAVSEIIIAFNRELRLTFGPHFTYSDARAQTTEHRDRLVGELVKMKKQNYDLRKGLAKGGKSGR